MLQRLQEEIIKQSDDHSIFAWDIRRIDQPGLLADSPSAFVNCFNVRRTSSRRGCAPYSMTNRGLSLKLMAFPCGPDTYLARLECTYEQQSTHRLGIFLRRLDEDDQYARVAVNGRPIFLHSLFLTEEGISETPRFGKFYGLIEINVRQKITASNNNAFKERVYGFHVHKELCATSHRSHDELHGIVESTKEFQDMLGPWILQHFQPIDTLDINRQDSWVRVMSLGLDFDHNPVCFMATSCGTSCESTKMEYFNELSDEEYIQRKSIYERSGRDTLGWSKISRFNVAEELTHHPGMWAIKGDRIEGVSVWVKAFGRLKIARKETECGRLVWDVCRSPSPQSTHSSCDLASESN